MSEHTIRILIVDDHEMVRKSIIAMVEREADMEVVGTGKDGREAIDLAQTTQPDVIVMDVSMPELDGIRAAGKIKGLNIPVLIIMLSLHYNSAFVQQARANGASGYVLKQEANKHLIPTIRAAYEGTLSL